MESLYATNVKNDSSFCNVYSNPIICDGRGNATFAVPVAQTADLSYAFGDSQDLQIQAMTQKEMDETEGAWAANAVGGIAGGLGGHFGYMGGAIASGTYNRSAHLGSIATGAIGGVINPVRGVGSVALAFGASTGLAGANAYFGNRGQNINIR